MARLELFNTPAERRVVVTLSKRNLLTLLRLLETPGPRMFENNDCYEDGVQTPWYPGEEADNPLARTTLVLRCEADEEHYGKRRVGPGLINLETERYVRDHGGAPAEVFVERPTDAT